jgi:F-type H+-transporting ATPase subunit a
MEHELWPTRLLNDYLAGPANDVLSLVRVHAENPARPWANYVAMQVLVALFIVVVFAVLRPRLSMDKPGKTQHLLEIIYQFLREQSEEVAGHEGPKFLAYFTTIFVFILFANLIGMIPSFESPTMYIYVTVGCALVTFVYYHLVGIQAKGIGKYILSFAGPQWYLAVLFFPIEIISHLGRPLSLSVRLYANMFAGEKVTQIFIDLTYIVLPVLFMGLHVFVAFLQAYVFTLLTMMYVGQAVSHEH